MTNQLCGQMGADKWGRGERDKWGRGRTNGDGDGVSTFGFGTNGNRTNGDGDRVFTFGFEREECKFFNNFASLSLK